MTSETYRIHWQGIEIEINYEPLDFKLSVAHLEVKSINPPRHPLPITETGYKSHYYSIGMFERDFDGDVIKCVTHWLNTEAKSKKWQAYVESSKQFSLF